MNKAFEQYPWQRLRDGFLTLQCCLNEIIEAHGDNDYKIPHINKAKLEREGQLPTSIRVTPKIKDFDLPSEDDGDDDDDDSLSTIDPMNLTLTED